MRSALCLLLVVAGTSASVLAQEAPSRQGFGISFGLGAGSGEVRCSGCITDRETGSSGYFRIGGYTRPDLFVGFESNGYVKSSNAQDTAGGFYSAVLQWYPAVESGFFLKGNIGVAGLIEDDGEDEVTVAAGALGVGVGYDFRMGRNFSLTPYASMMFMGKNNVKLNGDSTDFKASFNLIQIGLGFTWH